jgi:hypothetical protein
LTQRGERTQEFTVRLEVEVAGDSAVAAEDIVELIERTAASGWIMRMGQDARVWYFTTTVSADSAKRAGDVAIERFGCISALRRFAAEPALTVRRIRHDPHRARSNGST